MFTVPSALISSSVRNTSLPAAAALPDTAEPEAAEEEDALPQGRQILAAVGDRLTAQRLAALILMLRDGDEGTADEVAHLGRAPEHEHNDRRRLMPRLRALSVWMGSMASSPLRKASAM